MRIWFDCIKPFRDKSKTKASPFLDLNRSKYQYSYSEVYLGAKGKVTCLDKKIEIFMSFSVRDGILVKIKKNNLTEYCLIMWMELTILMMRPILSMNS